MSGGRIIVLSGGVGGAKLVLGLSHCVDPERLVVVTNTGDDFDHLGLRICPDTDTLLYTLSGQADPSRGWGCKDETWSFMESLKELGGPDWFNLGDRDLALHVMRTHRMRRDDTLTAIVGEVARTMGIEAKIVPMSDDKIATVVRTADGDLSFQHYFVRERCEPAVCGFRFDGADSARPNPMLQALSADEVDAVIVAPSNPYVSIDPILCVPGMTTILRGLGAPVVAVSPIVAGKALKGPTAKMMCELGIDSSACAVAAHYRDFINGIVIDEADADQAAAIGDLGIAIETCATVMTDLASRIALADRTIAFASRLAKRV